jgi:hypothetical protein
LGKLEEASSAVAELITMIATSGNAATIKSLAARLEGTILEAESAARAAASVAETLTAANADTAINADSDSVGTSNEPRQVKRRRVEIDAEETGTTEAEVAAATAEIEENDDNISGDNASISDNTSNSDSTGNGDNASDSTYSDEVEIEASTAFSHEPANTLKKRLNFTMKESYQSLDRFDMGELPDCNDIDLEFVAEQVIRLNNASVGVNELKEIGRYPFITPILTAVVESCQNMEHHSQYQLEGGKVAHGKPDWAIIYDGHPIFIVEAKLNIDNEAIAQTVLQMYEAHMKMRPTGDTKPWEMYGMVTTAVEVVFLKATFYEKLCTSVKWNGDVFYIPHDKETSASEYKDSARPVFQHLKAMLGELTGGPAAVHNAQPSQP